MEDGEDLVAGGVEIVGMELRERLEVVELVLVDFEDVASGHGGEEIGCVGSSAEIDIEDDKRAMGHGIDESVDCGTAYGTTLGERAETYGTRLTGKVFEGRGEGNGLPSDIVADIVGECAMGIEGYCDSARRIGDCGNAAAYGAGVELGDNLTTEVVGTYGTDDTRREAELAGVESEIGRRTAAASTFGEEIPQDLA